MERFSAVAGLAALSLFVSVQACGDKKEAPTPSETPKEETTPPADVEEPTRDSPDAQVDAESQASSYADEAKPVLTTGSVDGEALRLQVARRLRSDRSPVTILQGTSALALGKQICEEVFAGLGAEAKRYPASLPVLLKPNIGGYAGLKNPDKHGGDNGLQGRTTDPEFVRGVIRCLRSRGHNQIAITDSKNADHEHWEGAMEVSGYRALADDEGVELYAISDDGHYDIQGDMPGKPLAITGMEKTSVPTLLMPKAIAEHLDHGLLISLPKIKTHRFAVVSMAIKGLQGSVMYSDRTPAYRQKSRSHRELSQFSKGKRAGKEDRELYVEVLETFAHRMVDVLAIQAPHLVMAEGAPAMSGDGFHTLIPSEEFVAIGGSNPILVDAVGARFLGLANNEKLATELGGHHSSPLIEYAAERFGHDLKNIEVRGNGKGLLAKTRAANLIGFADFVIGESVGGSEQSESASQRALADAAYVPMEGIRLDGKADEQAWEGAPIVAWATDFQGQETEHSTKARFLWNEDGIYAHFEVENLGFFTDTSLPTSEERHGLYKEDCVELFLAPTRSEMSKYFEYEIGPSGHWHDIAVDLSRKKGRFDANWQSGMQVATQGDPKGARASIEVFLPARATGARMQKDERFGLGLFRMEGKSPDRKYLAWSPARTDKPRFHMPEAFGELVLRGPGNSPHLK